MIIFVRQKINWKNQRRLFANTTDSGSTSALTSIDLAKIFKMSSTWKATTTAKSSFNGSNVSAGAEDAHDAADDFQAATDVRDGPHLAHAWLLLLLLL